MLHVGRFDIFEFEILDFGFQTLAFCLILEFRFWTLAFDLKSGLWSLDFGLRFLDFEFNAPRLQRRSEASR